MSAAREPLFSPRRVEVVEAASRGEMWAMLERTANHDRSRCACDYCTAIREQQRGDTAA